MMMMEVEKKSKIDSTISGTSKDDEDDHDHVDDEDDVPLPGFRFHPTDEELVGFYLRRKVEKRPISIELIKQIDIYKYEPWDLPKGSNVGDKEWYFFCKRGRKYRNSIRPNRVTGSGFWKATGIDRPIYNSGGEGRNCIIGLKKSLVYYRGSAGKGTKTDWMMHEFRLPPPPLSHQPKSTPDHNNNIIIPQEAEVWTLCRIFKRNLSYRKCIPDWTAEVSAGKRNPAVAVDASSKTCSVEYSSDNNIIINGEAGAGFISFKSTPLMNRLQMIDINNYHEKKPAVLVNCEAINNHELDVVGQLSSINNSQAPSISNAISSYSSFFNPDVNEIFKYGDNWDDLRSVVDFSTSTVDPFL